MLESLAEWDLGLLHFLNVDLASPALDHFWAALSRLHKEPWFLLVVLPILIGRLIYIYRGQSIKVLIALGLAIGLADGLAYRGFKAFVHRQRPFQNSELDWVRKAGEAHGPSFPSNHAANVFAGAVVLAWYFAGTAPWMVYCFYIFAGLVALSRIALGVHYPSDVLAGVCLGIFVGLLIRILLLRARPLVFFAPDCLIPGIKVLGDRTRIRRHILV